MGCTDPYGTRPLHLCVIPDGTIVVASETCVFDKYNNSGSKDSFITEIKAGNYTLIENGYIKNIDVVKLKNTAFCLFEYIYFMKQKSQSKISGKSVGEMRYLLGVE